MGDLTRVLGAISNRENLKNINSVPQYKIKKIKDRIMRTLTKAGSEISVNRLTGRYHMYHA